MTFTVAANGSGGHVSIEVAREIALDDFNKVTIAPCAKKAENAR